MSSEESSGLLPGRFAVRKKLVPSAEVFIVLASSRGFPGHDDFQDWSRVDLRTNSSGIGGVCLNDEYSLKRAFFFQFAFSSSGAAPGYKTRPWNIIEG